MSQLSNIKVSTGPQSAPPVASPDVAPLTAPSNDAAPSLSPYRVNVIDAKTATVIDPSGRLIKIRKMSAFDRMRLFKAVGAEDSENRMFMSYANAAAAVTEIEGLPVTFPTSPVQVSAIVQRLDEDGLEAVVAGLIELNSGREDVAAAARPL